MQSSLTVLQIESENCLANFNELQVMMVSYTLREQRATTKMFNLNAYRSIACMKPHTHILWFSVRKYNWRYYANYRMFYRRTHTHTDTLSLC